MNGSSTTLIEIGFEDLFRKQSNRWNDFHQTITSEADAQERDELRRKSVASEFFLSGIKAIAMTGELVSCDAAEAV